MSPVQCEANQSLTMLEKQEICIYLKRNRMKPYLAIEWIKKSYNKIISPATLSRIKCKRPEDFDCSEPTRKKMRSVKYPEFEKLLLKFVKTNEDKTIFSDIVIIDKAERIKESLKIPENELKLSNGWLQKFKARHGIKLRTLHGESGSVDASNLHVYIKELNEIVSGYDPRNVFNYDESALFYRLPPSKTLATKLIHGKKKSKDRISIAFCCNMSGSEKMNPIVIGKFQTPRSFKNRKNKMNFDYYFNTNAWMTKDIFSRWLRNFDAKMHGRKVLLLLDNASCHLVSLNLLNVTLKFLPPSTTSTLQPLDAGIIRSFKARYRRHLVRWMVDNVTANISNAKLSIIDGIKFAIDSWESIPPQLIENCWVKCAFIPRPTVIQFQDETNDYSKPVTIQEEQDLLALISKLSLSMDPTEFIDIDNDIPTEAPDDIIDDVCDGADHESDDECEPCITATVGLEYCQKLRSLVNFYGGDRHCKDLNSLTDFIRTLCTSRMKQTDISSYCITA